MAIAGACKPIAGPVDAQRVVALRGAIWTPESLGTWVRTFLALDTKKNLQSKTNNISEPKTIFASILESQNSYDNYGCDDWNSVFWSDSNIFPLTGGSTAPPPSLLQLP